MIKWLHKILLFVAVTIIIGHTSLPHHHHEEIEAAIHHHHHEEEHGTESNQNGPYENKEDKHSIFSFAQLDEIFVPVKLQVVSIEVPILYLFSFVNTCQFNQIREKSKTHFGYYREFPPPTKYLSSLFSRPPPAC